MKNPYSMKSFLVFSTFFILQLGVYGQTNTFPSIGKAGIGTTSPAAELHIKKPASVAIYVESEGYGSIQLGAARFPNAYSPLAQSGSVVLRSFSNTDFIIAQQSGNDLHFATRTNVNDLSTEDYRMTITADGNVGIGKTNPTDKLEVNGRIHARWVRIDLNNWSDYVF